MKIVFHIVLFIVLTILTQIGGIVYVLSLWYSKRQKHKSKLLRVWVFILLYLISTKFFVPRLAPLFGREMVHHSERIQPTNYMTVLLNRNYVHPELNELLKTADKDLKGTNIHINYLDANFPFINKFPLLPHLSHNDGKKIDLSLVYETSTGEITNKQKSRSGYGVFEDAKPSEIDQVRACIENGYSQYDFPKYLTFGSINSDLNYSNTGTKQLIQSLLKSQNLGKIFIEPHLKARMNLQDSRIRYHGCNAVRHDDHIHIQLK